MTAITRLAWLFGTALIIGCTSRSGAPLGRLAAGTPPGSDKLPPMLAEVVRGKSPAVAKAPPLEGTVEFPEGRKTQASAGDVVNAATVSLIDPNSNMTVAATVTNFKGGFSLSLAGFLPEINAPYIVEAVKGLAGHMPGHDSPRFRTIVKFNGTAWESISTPTVVISSLTTAVAIEAGLYPDKVDPANTMNKVNVSVRPAALNRDPQYTDHPNSEILKLATDITSFLVADFDPVQVVPEVVPIVTSVSTDSGRINDIVEIKGIGFSPIPSGNTITFGGEPAKIILATPTRILVTVPEKGQTGSVVVQTGRGSVSGPGFNVAPAGPTFSITFAYPDKGTPGTEVTILGYGFSKNPGENTVFFDQVSAPCSSSDINFCTTRVPTSAVKGPIKVRTPSGDSNTLAFSVQLQPTITGMFPTQGAPGTEITISGSNFGAVAGKVAVSGVDAPVVSWKDSEIVAQAPFGSVAGNLTVTKGSLPAQTVGTFGLLSGIISSWTTINNSPSNNTHNGGWHGRWRKWWYLGGGYASCGTAAQCGYNKGPVERAVINEDGSLGPLEVLPGVEIGDSMWVMEAGYNMADSPNVIGDYAYAYPAHPSGGFHCGVTAVYRARFFPDGSMSNFAPVYQTAYPPGHWQSIIRVKDYVHIIGGTGCGNDGKTQSAKINADGTLQPFNVSPAGSPFGFSNGVARVGRYVYMFGGPARSEVHRIEVNPDGSFKGGWVNSGPGLPHRLALGNVAVIGQYVYAFGGHSWEGWGWTSAVWRSSINAADDSLGPWQQVTGMPSTGAHDGGVLVVGGRMYYSGVCCHVPHIYVGTIQ